VVVLARCRDRDGVCLGVVDGMTHAWQPPETAPKDGRDIIVWTSSSKGFQDMTVAINWYAGFDDEGAWVWAGSGDRFLGPIHGWMEWPDPHAGERPDGTKAVWHG
jgi:hypothetical protein